MPHVRTLVTEVVTGLGMLGAESLDDVLARRSDVMHNLSPETWAQLAAVKAGGAFDAEFHAAWENGRAFLAARDGLRGRRPEVVEWKGSVRAAGDEVAPVDLRVDHVYLISCKYLSNILFNASPSSAFDALLVGRSARPVGVASGDWYAEVAPGPYQHLYERVRASLATSPERNGHSPAWPATPPAPRPRFREPFRDAPAVVLPGFEGETPEEPLDASPGAATPPPPSSPLAHLPERAVDLSSAQRAALAERLRAGWPRDAKAAYTALADTVAQASAARWKAALEGSAGKGESMLWRLLRMGSAPYYVLGSSPTRSLRLRIATPWDWRQQFSLAGLEVFAQRGGQPRVGWEAKVRVMASGELRTVAGHVEVRWSHGRFGGPPEAKGYLDTPHDAVPGYFALR